MKMLLTSAGLSNPSIAASLLKLVAIPAEKVHLAFIPTAANVIDGDKGWLIDDFLNLKKQGYGCIDFVDISALPKDIWLGRLEVANILMFGGGNNYHLMYWLRKSGLDILLPELVETRVYVGVSAGSMVLSKRLLLTADRPVILDNTTRELGDAGLGWVNFYIRPHYNSPYFSRYTAEFLKEAAKSIGDPIYVIDDQTAIIVADGKEEIVSEGEYLVLNKK